MRSLIRSNRDGLDRNNLPWLLTKQQRNDVKEVSQRIKFPTGFASNINNILTKKGEFGGVKTHDWHTFIKVIILVYIFIYIGLIHILSFLFFLFTLVETNNDSFFLLQYVLPLSFPNDFDNNVKQVIYDIGKYMR
jgi:hypothetical protein